MNKQGSAAIMVIFITAIIVMLTTYMMKSSVYMHDVALERQRYAKEYYMVCGLFNYAVALCTENFEYFHSQGNDNVRLALPQQLLEASCKNADMQVVKQDDTHLLITVQVKGNETMRTMHGTLCQHEKSYALEHWQYQ